jgi:hypothetical protein
MVVVPGVNVEWKFAAPYVDPLGIVIEGSTVPMFVAEDERLMVVSCTALAGFPLESCNCTKMQLYVLSSAGTLVGPT